MKTTEVVDQVVWQVVGKKEEEGVINKMGQNNFTRSKVYDNFPSLLLHAHGRGH